MLSLNVFQVSICEPSLLVHHVLFVSIVEGDIEKHLAFCAEVLVLALTEHSQLFCCRFSYGCVWQPS